MVDKHNLVSTEYVISRNNVAYNLLPEKA